MQSLPAGVEGCDDDAEVAVAEDCRTEQAEETMTVSTSPSCRHNTEPCHLARSQRGAFALDLSHHPGRHHQKGRRAKASADNARRTSTGQNRHHRNRSSATTADPAEHHH